MVHDDDEIGNALGKYRANINAGTDTRARLFERPSFTEESGKAGSHGGRVRNRKRGDTIFSVCVRTAY